MTDRFIPPDTHWFFRLPGIRHFRWFAHREIFDRAQHEIILRDGKRSTALDRDAHQFLQKVWDGKR